MVNDPMNKTPAEQQQLKVPPPAASGLQSLQNVVVTSLWSNWVLFELLQQEIQLQRLLRQQSLSPRPPSTSNTTLPNSCNNTTANAQPCCSSATTFIVPVNDLNKNNADDSSQDPAPTTAAEVVSPSPTHRQQAAGQKPKPSKNRYNAFVSQPEDKYDYSRENSPNQAPTKTAEIVTPSPTHRQQLADHKPKHSMNIYDEALDSQPEDAHDCSPNPAPIKSVEVTTPSRTHREQAAGQKPKPSRSRYDATPVLQPEDDDEYISNPATTQTAEMVTPSATHRQQVAGPKPKPSKYRYDTALVSQQVRQLPSSSKFDTRNMLNILRTRAAKQATMSKEPADTLPGTQGYEKAAPNTATLPAVKQRHQPTNGRSPSGTSKYEGRLWYKKGAPNCRTRLQCAPRVHQYQPACPPSNIRKVEPPPKDTASNSSHNEKLINNNTSVAEDQAQMPQGTTTETLPTSKLSMQPKEDNKVPWYVNAIGEFCLSNNTEAVLLTDARCLTAEEIRKILFVRTETEYLIQNRHLEPIGSSNSFYWLDNLATS